MECPICLNSLVDQEIGSPESCDHTFCLSCIREWAKVVNTCPIDRSVFNVILIRNSLDGPVVLRAPVPRRRAELPDIPDEEEDEPEVDEEVTSCEVCGSTDREERLLLCDGCDAGYHLECCDPPLDSVPVDEWFCPQCTPPTPIPNTQPSTSTRDAPTAIARRRVIPRTRMTERVRARIMRNLLMTDVSSDDEDNHSFIDDTQNVVDLVGEAEDELEDEIDYDSEDNDDIGYVMNDEELDVASTSTAVLKKPAVRKKPVKRRKTKGKRRTTKRRKRKVKGRGKRRVVRRRKITLPHDAKESVHKRLANKLGLVAPREGRFLPTIKGESSSAGSNNNISQLHLFGDPMQAMQCGTESESSDDSEGGQLSRNAKWFNRPLRKLTQKERDEMAARRVQATEKLKQVREREANPRRKEIDESIEQVVNHVSGIANRQSAPPPQANESVDLLDSILDGQTVLHVPSKHMQIEKDGTLKVNESAMKKHIHRKEMAKVKHDKIKESTSKESSSGASCEEESSCEFEQDITDLANPNSDNMHEDLSLAQLIDSIYRQATKPENCEVKSSMDEKPVKTVSPDSSSVIEDKKEEIEGKLNLDETQENEIDSTEEMKTEVEPEPQLVSSTVEEHEQIVNEQPIKQEYMAGADCSMDDMDLEDEEEEQLEQLAPQTHVSYGKYPSYPPKPAPMEDCVPPADSLEMRIQAHLNKIAFGQNAPPPPMLPLQSPCKRKTLLPAPANNSKQFKQETSEIESLVEQANRPLSPMSFARQQQETRPLSMQANPVPSGRMGLVGPPPTGLIRQPTPNLTIQSPFANLPGLAALQAQAQAQAGDLSQQLQIQKQLLEMNPIFLQNLQAQINAQQQQQNIQNMQAQQEQQVRQQQEAQLIKQHQDHQVQMLLQEQQKLLLSQGLAGLPPHLLQTQLPQLLQQGPGLIMRPPQPNPFMQPNMPASLPEAILQNMFNPVKQAQQSQPNVNLPEVGPPSNDASTNLPPELVKMVNHINDMHAQAQIRVNQQRAMDLLVQQQNLPCALNLEQPAPIIQEPPPRVESADKRARHLRFSEDVIEHPGEECRPSLTKRLRQATGDAKEAAAELSSSPYSPTALSPIVDETEMDLEHKLSKASKKQKIKQMMMEATSTTDDDQATSAVDLNKRKKILNKFNYQMRVEEEVKQALRPFYSKKKINKDEYKDIMRRAVPKIAMKKGVINPIKIASFIEAYVKMAVQARSKS